MDEMEHVGRVVKRINERLKSKRGLADIARDAEEIRAAATRMPPCSGGKPGWSLRGEAGSVGEVAGVRSGIPGAVEKSEKLAGAARTGQEPAISAQFRSMTRTCSGCHDAFREKR